MGMKRPAPVPINLPFLGERLQTATQAPSADRPWVTLAWAQSIDGCLTVRQGQPTPLSGPESAVLTHQLRAAHHAIMVGIGTLLADDPRLNVRHITGPNPQAIILDSQLRTPLTAKVLQGQQPALIVGTSAAPPARQAALIAAGAEVLIVPATDSGQINLPALLPSLAERGLASVMVEGGGQVLTAFLTQQLANAVCITVVPKILGGYHAVADLNGAIANLTPVAYHAAGADMTIIGGLQ